MQSGKFLSLESESPEFLEEYTRVIDSDEVKHAEETIDENDPWIGLEVAIRPDGESDPIMATVKRRKIVRMATLLGSAIVTLSKTHQYMKLSLLMDHHRCWQLT